MSTAAKQFDLNPHPRILPILGEINLVQWRCVAELVDNSVDAFLSAKRANKGIEAPTVEISTPLTDEASGRLSIRDNGPGMDIATLENAVKAGWTSNDPINNLGMFGMGFNIATARLGSVTKVWTTRSGDPEWAGLEINFEALVRQRHFRTEMLTRPKLHPGEHGTEISIDRLKPEQRQWFAKKSSRTTLARELGRAYSTMLRANGSPIAFRLILNNQSVPGRNHCVWGDGAEQRTVHHPTFGEINALQQIDKSLKARPFCTACWQWLGHDDTTCPSCGAKDAVVERKRRVRGWVGLQRYLSESDFGIDFIRNGRKIEMGNRDLFVWRNEDRAEEEYPIDDPRHRGRLVGEIHVDHCRVNYTKDRFDRNDPAWDEMNEIVRGKGPLRPDKAHELGYGRNDSPLALLFHAFRRTSPKNKVAGCYRRLLIIPRNEEAESLAQKFYAGEPDFVSDTKWWALVEEADKQLLAETGGKNDGGDTGALLNFGPATAEASAPFGGSTPSTPTVATPPQRRPVAALSKDFRDDLTGQVWRVTAAEAKPGDPAFQGRELPWRLLANASGIFEFIHDPNHSIFRSATMTPLDGLLAELAWSAMDANRSSGVTLSYGAVLSSLRERYAGRSRLDPAELGPSAGVVLSDIAKQLSGTVLADEAKTIFDDLVPSEREAVLRTMALRGAPSAAISDGRILQYVPRRGLPGLVEQHPELFFDGRVWNEPYAGLDYGSVVATAEAKTRVLRHYAGLLHDVVWLAESDASELLSVSRERLLRAALALELLGRNAVTDANG